VCRALKPLLEGRKFAAITLRRQNLRFPFPPSFAARLKNQKVKNVGRRAKYILIHLMNHETLIIHLGMSGRLTIQNKKTPPLKHDHVIIELDSGQNLVFNDARRFGLMDLAATKTLESHQLFNHLGIEPLSPRFNAGKLAAWFKNKKTAVKLALLDQRGVVGVGNIYASEALYHAGISPKRMAGQVKLPELKRLAPAIKKTLRRSIKAGGSSLRDYRQVDGELGWFQDGFAVYDRAGLGCPGCFCADKVKKIIQGGRSTFYCPKKQS
ncbi:MAG: bifunctional DNA-formamidopyrimidine glycosylase/DNA-(apurinic or apyrimidinic site) lyase, partial [Dongiaceae bacterium]